MWYATLPMGIGRFLDATVLQVTGPADWAQRLLQHIPNLHLADVRGNHTLFSSSGALVLWTRR